MKKLTFIAAAAVAMIFASCGNKSQQPAAEAVDSVAFEQSMIEEKAMLVLDSLADEWSKLKPVQGVLVDGKIQLSEDEIKVKPTYLLEPKATESLVLLSQKYRAFGMLVIDTQIAKMYNIDLEPYKTAIGKIATDLNDASVVSVLPNKITKEFVKERFVKAKENGRINYFWELTSAIVIEALYVVEQNTDKLLPAFDDDSATNITRMLNILKLSIDELAAYDKNLEGLAEALTPLSELKANSVDELKEQLAKMKPQIEAARAELLK